MTAADKPDALNMIASPAWHIHDFHELTREFTLLSMSEDDYRRSVFLDTRHLPKGAARFKSGFGQTYRLFSNAGKPPGSVSFVFHVGHCGSTLLATALAGSRSVLPLREPRMLKVLSKIFRELNEPVSQFTEPDWQRLRDIVLFGLSRTFHPGQHLLVKATSTCNNLVIPLLETASNARAILLYQPLEPFIAGFFKQSTDARDLIIQARDRMLLWTSIPGAAKLRIADLAPEQLAAMSWLTSMYCLLEATEVIPGRTMMVNFDDFLGDPENQLVAIDSFLDTGQDANEMLHHYASISAQYSKRPDMPFTSENRQEGFASARRKHGKKISRGMQWAEQMIEATPVLKRSAAFFE
jgi:hypothetical protein